MAQGLSIHIGLNHIDENVYGPGNDLAGCVNDAHDMQALAVAQGFQTTLMLDEAATSGAVIQAISGAAQSLRAGDLLLLTYSGHGSQVPDRNGDEPDGQDETWCLYDRMLIDDELNQLWSQFAAGTRIVMLSDSCHSGTVARMIRARELAAASPISAAARSLITRARAAANPPPMGGVPPVQNREPRFRWLPPEASARAYRQANGLYDTLQRLVGRDMRDSLAASVILISGCQDNQLSADGDRNGLFTEKLLEVWASGGFTGDYRLFHQQILDRMPMDQTPNYFTTGATNAAFEGERPFTITTDATNEPVNSALWVTGPETMERGGPAPGFQVNPGPNSYYIFEITGDASLFDTGNASDRRTEDNFYGSWSDGAHMTSPDYTLPDAVWQRLKAFDRLYYRIGSTAAATGWINYMVSTPDQMYDSAPSIAISAGQSAGGGEEGTAPAIWGPSELGAGDAAPGFDIDTGGAPWFIVEVAVESRLFDSEASGADRTDENFYGSWSDTALLTGSSYVLPDPVWQRLALTDALFYRVGTTTSETGWENYLVSIGDADHANAPTISITGSRSPSAKRAARELA